MKDNEVISGISFPFWAKSVLISHPFPAQINLEMRRTVKTKRAAIYVRVSTNDQETEMQETELRNTAKTGVGAARSTEIKARAVPRMTARL
jgi:hypothetical protein